MTILDEIVDYKRAQELPRQKQAISLEAIMERASGAGEARDFVATLRNASGVAIIAELKKASPSKGLLRPSFDPLALLEVYVMNGAAAVSVLTDEKFFQGQLQYLEQAAEYRALTGGNFGILRKDFVVDPYQIYEARAAGADAVLLIMAVLGDAEIRELLELTHVLGMEALIEVHDDAELERALAFNPRLVGVNNRNLRDFSVDLDTCLALRPHAPAGVCFVAESGIHHRADVEKLGRAGVDAILVGESIVASRDPGAQLRSLGGVPRREVEQWYK